MFQHGLHRCQGGRGVLHHLLLHRWLRLHHVATLVEVLDVCETERTTAVLIASELLDSGLSVALRAELDYARASRAAIGLVLDLSPLNLADRGEELDQIIVASAPWQLKIVSLVSEVDRRRSNLRCGRRW